MPYKDKSQLPSYVKRRNDKDQERWMTLWNDAFRKTGSETDAFHAANNALSLSVRRPSWASLRAAAERDRTFVPVECFVSSVFPDWDASGIYKVQYVRTGIWREHYEYGDIVITNEDLAESLRNYRHASRRPFLDDDHGITNPEMSEHPGVAFGWMKDYWVETLDGHRFENPEEVAKSQELVLIAFAEYEVGEEANEWIKTKKKPLFSPTFHPFYKNKETGETQGMTVLGGAMTAIPYFDGMEQFVAVAASDGAVIRRMTAMYPNASLQVSMPGNMTHSTAAERLKRIGFEITSIEYWTLWIHATDGGDLSKRLGELEDAGFTVVCFYQGVQMYNRGHRRAERGENRPGAGDVPPMQTFTQRGETEAMDFKAFGLRLFKDATFDSEQGLLDHAVREMNTRDQAIAARDQEIVTLRADLKSRDDRIAKFESADADRAKVLRESVVQGAIDAFKIDRGKKEEWLKRYDENADTVTAILSEMKPDPELAGGEIGRGGSDGPAPAGGETMSQTMREIESLADRELKADPKLNGDRVAARMRVFSSRPELYDKYRDENTRGANGKGAR